MDRLNHYFISILLILVLLCCTFGYTTMAQSFESPGYPWTYVPRQELPIGILNTDQENRLDTISWICPNTEIRRVFYIYAHPELMEGDNQGEFPIIIPREPNEADTINMQNFFLDTTLSSNSLFIAMGGFRSYDRPEYAFGDVELFCTYNISGDTSCGGYIANLPTTYRIISNLTDYPWTRWLNFVQCVDSIWHPPLTSSSREILLGQMEALTVYPNPVQQGGRVYLQQPNDWPRGPSELVLTGTAGRVLFRRLLVGPPDEQGYTLPPDLAPGIYSLVVLSEGRRAAARVVVR